MYPLVVCSHYNTISIGSFHYKMTNLASCYYAMRNKTNVLNFNALQVCGGPKPNGKDTHKPKQKEKKRKKFNKK